MLEKATPSGQAAVTDRIENSPGFPDGIGGLELANQVKTEVECYGVEIMQTTAAEIDVDGPYRVVRTEKNEEFNSWAALVATGGYRRLGVPREEELNGRGVHFCATCDAPLYQNTATGDESTLHPAGAFIALAARSKWGVRQEREQQLR